MKCKDCPHVKLERMSNLPSLVIYGYCHHKELRKSMIIGRDLDIDGTWFCPLKKDGKGFQNAERLSHNGHWGK